eukprot:UN21090
MTEMADSISGQVEVGCSLRAFEKMVGFGTVLNSLTNRAKQWCQILKKYLIKKDPQIGTLSETKMWFYVIFST